MPIVEPRTRSRTCRLTLQTAMTICGLMFAAQVAVAAPGLLDWDDLRPPAVVEDNPFTRLNAEQIDLLSELARSRIQQRRFGRGGDAAQAREREVIAILAAQGLDAEALLLRRDSLIAERRAQAETPIPEADGRTAELRGYIVPVSGDDLQVTEFLLIPWAGACSHTPPPPPNQVVHVRPATPVAVVAARQYVTVSGAVRVSAQEQTLNMIDGLQTVRSGYSIDTALVIPASTTSDEQPGQRQE